MNSSFYLTLATLIYVLLIYIIYVLKKKVKTEENKLYFRLLNITLLSILSESILAFLYSKHWLILEISMRLFLICTVIWIFVLFKYLLTLIYPNQKKSKLSLTFHIILYFLLTLFTIILPVNYTFKNGILQYSSGPAINYDFTIAGIFLFIMIMILIRYRKKLKSKKIIPIITFILLIITAIIVQNIKPEYLLINFVFGITVSIMYHTIENPDLKLIEELNVAKDQAEKANNAKTDFLSNMSHEIRTPLNAIVGFSNGLLEDNNIPEESKEDIKNIITASDNLIELVNGILDISKIEANKLEIINTNYNFKKLFNDLLILTKARLGEKPLELKYYYDETIPEYLYGDVSRIKQIIINLLTNSVKYTKEGYIYFKVNAIKKENIIRLIISVEDTGIGIKQENIDKLFTKFERLGVEKNTTSEGTGLGLAITKKLVELMNGKIIVQSIYGKGSKFTVSIDQRISNHQEIENIKKETETKITHENIDITNKKILIVDDNNLNLKVAERLLKKYTQNIQTASSGQECLDKINNNEEFDLILLDDMMPKMSGTLTLEKLKENENFKTPVVVLTANAISGMKEQYLSKGFDDYLSKPIEKGELIRVIKKFLS